MKQYSENQYDVDLTLGNDEYDESYYSDADDLFELSTDDESPISRLKSLVLSIDWEITDDVLLQFNEELLDLKDIWAGDNINLVYIQALEKISKYIYQNKADSHPNAIKLLLTFYYNLEKIVSSQDITEQQKKEILLEDVKKFENLKRQIKQKTSPAEPIPEPKRPPQPKAPVQPVVEDELQTLKAIVLGIDWEITEQDLNELRKEVNRLEGMYSTSRPKLILLQGIGTLGAYIKLKKSNAHPDAFKVLQLFYESLEKIVQQSMSLEEEKTILFPAVEKFNSFKTLIGPTISPESISQNDTEAEDEEDEDLDGDESVDGELSPALADFAEEEGSGFQAEKEAMALGLEDASGNVDSHLNNFFGETPVTESSEKEKIPAVPEEEFSSFDTIQFKEEDAVPVGRDVALQGVDVEEDDSDEDIEAHDRAGEEAIASMALDEAGSASGPVAGFEVDADLMMKDARQEDEVEISHEETIIDATESKFPTDMVEPIAAGSELDILDRETALKGVDVETEADDDSDELSLPMEGEELAPALASMEEESLFSATTLEKAPASSSVSEEIVGTIDGLFKDHEDLSIAPALSSIAEEEPVAVTGIEEKNEEEELLVFEDWLKEESKPEEAVTEQKVAEVPVTEESVFLAVQEKTEEQPEETPAGSLIEIEPAVSFSEDQEEDSLSSFFTESELEQSAKDGAEIDALFDSLETEPTDGLEEEFAEGIQGSVAPLLGFDTTADVEQPEEISLPIDFKDGSGEEEVKQEPALSFIPGTELPADEVVFELFEEKPTVEVVAGDEYVEEKEMAVAVVEGAAEENLLPPSQEETELGFEEESFEDIDVTSSEPASLEPLAGMQACIHSLELELSDGIIVGLFGEINHLRQLWADKPLEKSFLQLLSTVGQHIDNYRYESSSEAHGLLISVYHALSNLKDDDIHANQEALLAQTLKVLEWQQGMLSRQAVQKGSQLTFSDPLRTEAVNGVTVDAQKDFDDLLGEYESATKDTEPSGSEPTNLNDRLGDAGHESVDLDEPQVAAMDEVAREGQQIQEADAGLSGEAISNDLRKEIAALRQTLQMEIAELRKELKKE
ncbi:MAG: hypothetical protein OEL83_15485 [Desulforhopalus sp.]|nr:hypothetical protein [Desulforhopalus sp.]